MGCLFQERHGWERPGWFSSSPAPSLPYDWYGAYEHTPKHADHQYEKLLRDDYSFDFPAHHHQACVLWGCSALFLVFFLLLSLLFSSFFFSLSLCIHHLSPGSSIDGCFSDRAPPVVSSVFLSISTFQPQLQKGYKSPDMRLERVCLVGTSSHTSTRLTGPGDSGYQSLPS